MGTLVAVFPLAIVVLALAVALLALRLDRRLSRGASSAGPLESERPKPAGLTQTPWELRGIDDQLERFGRSMPAASRSDMTATVNRLTVAAGLHDPRHQLPTTASQAQLEHVVALIEEQLGLPPLSGRARRR